MKTLSTDMIRIGSARIARLAGVTAAAVLVAAVALQFAGRASAEDARVIPSPSADEKAGSANTETTVLAGGCFWGVQGVFQHVNGVISATSGYTGGSKAAAHYEMVSDGDTGHAESVRIVFDPHKISYGHLLQIYFSVAHDPTELNYQGPDSGTQYRSAIFPTSQSQADIAKAYIDQLNHAKVFDAAIVTKIEPARQFYAAEDYHQDFLTTHPSYPYIVINDLPKIKNLQHLFPGDYRAAPVLVTASASAN
ncbi:MULTISPECIES: peptide-methionine (S)-S-oxide reductase MsrA [unclassified Rhizobium]|jgi:peptide-methionine (S)-S-oxide reductase|uniref:peptide-methionine (S)-S-oxide reductase MsrA n=1 Tax=unclassified Rhizobium TaxID=2613769 RepID=UPI0006462C40|nr:MULTISPECIES: peptide-methionine (S)-S-oxide reductase MsrA [unclassified Rhizobium]MBN8954690.1 peptide-methionine (S)-S-oxide reductase MsrA [Rhizobium tropici]OJY75468.1 MAG: peptide-methionine (S)-S-oxide reductase [Rhizobium sp. 60-20]RKD70510.1 peptide-methionine (S)-S-oxide reductase [Rhizobium sp. WW_1]